MVAAHSRKWRFVDNKTPLTGGLYGCSSHQKCRFVGKNHEKCKIIDKTPYFKNSLKNPIFEIEGSNMDQMKENYLTHMNLVLTHFCQNVVLYGCCSQRLIYSYSRCHRYVCLAIW